MPINIVGFCSSDFYVLCEVGAGAEETFDDLQLTTETDCAPCHVRTEAEERVA